MSYNTMISIIVPVYNKEKWIAHQINSLLKQDYRSFEIILVNDGSSDNSGKICDDYSRNANVTVIHQNNQGVCAARNAGFAIAKGKYIGFMDADDEIKPEMYQKMIEFCEDNSLDIAICGTEVHQLDDKVMISNGKGTTFVSNRFETVKMFLNGGYFTYGACNKIYRKSIIDNIKFQNGIKINEDKLFMYQAICNSDRIGVLGKALFINHKRADSASTSYFNKSFFDIETVSSIICEDVKVRYSDLYPDALYSRYRKLMELIRRMCRENALSIYPNEVDRIFDIIKSPCEYSQSKRLFSKKDRFERWLCVNHTNYYFRMVIFIYKLRRFYAN